MPFNPQDYFDLNNILVNEIVGSIMLFTIIMLAIIVYVGAKNNVVTPVLFMLMGIFVSIIAANYSLWAFWIFVGMIASLVGYAGYVRFFRNTK